MSGGFCPRSGFQSDFGSKANFLLIVEKCLRGCFRGILSTYRVWYHSMYRVNNVSKPPKDRLWGKKI